MPELAVLVVLMAVTAVLFQALPLDLSIQRAIADSGLATPWQQHKNIPWTWFYQYAGLIAVAAVAGSFCVLVAGLFRPALRRFRAHSLFVILVFAIGPGLIVNLLLKEQWGRPRPRDLREFGGRWEYREALDRGTAGKGKSFPCGHSSVGFGLIVFYFLLRRRRRAAGLALALTLVLGMAMGYARMLAGAHFLSDVLWSAYAVVLPALLLYYVVLNIPGREDAPALPAARRTWPWIAVGALTLLGAVAAALFATPVYKEFDLRQALPSPDAGLSMDFTGSDVELRLGNQPGVFVEGTAEGFGWSGADVLGEIAAPIGDRREVRVLVRPAGWFTELSTRLRVTIPRSMAGDTSMRLAGGTLAADSRAVPSSFKLILEDGASANLPAAWQGAAGIDVEGPPGSVTYR